MAPGTGADELACSIGSPRMCSAAMADSTASSEQNAVARVASNTLHACTGHAHSKRHRQVAGADFGQGRRKATVASGQRTADRTVIGVGGGCL